MPSKIKLTLGFTTKGACKKKDDILDRKVVYQSFTSCTIVRRRACCLAKVRRV